MSNSDSIAIKFCKKCQCETHRYKSGACKPCTLINAAKWKSENKDKESQIKARYYRSHADEAKSRSARNYELNKSRKTETVAAWKQRNPEKVKLSKEKYASSGKEADTKKRYHLNNAQRLKEAKRLWFKNNPDAVYRANHARRARRQSAGGVLSKGLRQKLFAMQRGKCACCGKPLGLKYALDHIMPLALGGSNTDDNIQLLRQRCNSQKHAKHPVDFMQERGFLL